MPSTVSKTASDLVAFLQRPSSYPNRTKAVELRETHISWVFLAGHHAYKLKKPVRFDFLDFSSCELRKQACESELLLNRRLSPDVYQAVVPICRWPSGALSIGGEGEVVDWLVKMRRLDDQRTLEALLTGPSTAEEVESRIRPVGSRLAQFYATQAPVTVRTAEIRESLRRHVDENERQLLQIASSNADSDLIRLIHSSQKRFLVTHQDVFDDRVRDGRIVDGHGDLRPEHIYLYDQPLVIDCIEFNAEYRQNDIVDELAFLAMECDRLGHPSIGRILFEAYADESNDIVSERLAAFYMTYRACVRAKVAALRGRQQEAQQAETSLQSEREYLGLAAKYVRDLGPRLVVMVGGLMGTGKTTLAKHLGLLLSGQVLSSDIIRQQRGGANAAKRGFGEGKYSVESRLATYQALVDAAASAFVRTDTVILDATFTSADMRRLVVDLASSYDAKLMQVECECPRDIAIRRIADRVRAGGSASEALPEFYDLQAAESDPPLAAVPLVHVDTALAMGRQEALVLELVQGVISGE